MNIILLSGGSGTRLWPLTSDIRSKQFIRIFRGPDQGPESMVQRVYRQIRAADPDAVLTVATGSGQVPVLREQLGEGIDISVEPCRRDTFPAIALAAAYLHDVKGVAGDEAVAVCPVDPYAGDAYFRRIGELCEAAGRGKEKLYLIGIDPSYPSDKYGYIRPVQAPDGHISYRFTEKPDTAAAAQYIREGALWNSGVFAFRLSYILDKAAALLGTDRYQQLSDHYADLEKISFDYAVTERETSIGVLRYAGPWEDLGSWNTLTEAMEENSVGNVRMDGTCSNVHVINELDIPILVLGLKDAVITATPEGILVSDKKASPSVKTLLDAMDRPSAD